MAKKTTMKRKMKKGTRKYRGGVRDRKPTEKGQSYKASIAAKTVSKIQNKELQTKVDDLTTLFRNATISETSPKTPVQ